MNAHVKHVVQECTAGSDQGRLGFPEVVGRLMEAGIERYHADLRRAEKTYYLPSGESFVTPAEAVDGEPAQAFSAGEVEAAIRAIQAGSITYGEFCARIMEAGCVGYLVSLAGKRAVYYGRTGEMHVELFPGAK